VTAAARARGFLLPPRPRLRDWPAAGAAAGLLLGGGDLLWAAQAGAARAPLSLVCLILGFDAGVGAALATATALALRGCGIRLCYSAAAGALVGVQAGIATLDLGLAAASVKLAPAGALAAVVLSGLCAAGAGAALARLGERLEDAGLPLAALPLWAASGLLLAGAGAAASSGSSAGLALLAGALCAPGIAWLALRTARARGVRARAPLSEVALHAGLLVALGAGAHQAMPWLRYAGELPSLSAGPPSLLLVSADPELGRESAEAAAELIGWNGVRYAGLAGDPAQSGLAQLRLPDGRSLAAALREAGFASASLHAAAPGLDASDFAEVDAATPPLTALAREAPGVRGLAWLHCCAKRVVPALRLDATRRTPAELSRLAGRWLLDWRSRRAQRPFVLRVDYRAAESDAAGLIPALGELLRQLDQHEIAQRTLIVLALPGARGSRGKVVVRVPEGWPLPAPERREVRGLRANALAEALLAASLGDPRARALPGVAAPEQPAAEAEPAQARAELRGGSGGSAHSMISAMR